MVCALIGGFVGYLLGSLLSQLVFGPTRVIARPCRPAVRRGGHPGAAFLMLILATFGGVAAGSMAF